jgi:hypothetical protein
MPRLQKNFGATPMKNRTNTHNRQKNWLAHIALSLSSLLAANASATDVSVSIGGEIKPGVYGRVDIGTRPPPPVLYPQPVLIVAQPRQSVVVQPVYMHVPPGHAKKWGKHCHKYAACGQPVYFVKSPSEVGSNEKHHGKGKHKHHKKD